MKDYDEDAETVAKALFINWRELRHPVGGARWSDLTDDQRNQFLYDAEMVIRLLIKMWGLDA